MFLHMRDLRRLFSPEIKTSSATRMELPEPDELLLTDEVKAIDAAPSAAARPLSQPDIIEKRFHCARTGEPFRAIYERRGEIYSFARSEKLRMEHESPAVQPMTDAASRVLRTPPVSIVAVPNEKIDSAGFQCPCCGETGRFFLWVNDCAVCGKSICGCTVQQVGDSDLRWYQCICGRSSTLVAASENLFERIQEPIKQLPAPTKALPYAEFRHALLPPPKVSAPSRQNAGRLLAISYRGGSK